MDARAPNAFAQQRDRQHAVCSEQETVGLSYSRLTQISWQGFPDANKFSGRRGPHLTHDAAAMELDGDHTDAEVEGDLLVEASARHLAKNLALTRGEGSQPLDISLSIRSLALAQYPFPFRRTQRRATFDPAPVS